MDQQLARSVLVVHDFIGGGCTLGDALTEVAGAAADALGADMAGMSLNDASGRATTAVYTDGMAPEIDQAQYDAGDGPCLESFRVRQVVRMGESETEQRWPEFAAAAARHGVRATVSFPLVVGDRGVGVLNLYDRRAGHFGDELVEPGRVFAGQAAVLAAYYDRADTAQHLTQALETRAVIEQAKGVIMATVGCGPDDAFDLLRQQSQAENRKLRDLATDLVGRQQRR